MALNLLLDECINSTLLLQLLGSAGHTVTRSVDVVGRRAHDPVVLAYAGTHEMVLLTRNPGDFVRLHHAGTPHNGIILIYEDNDPSRDMTYDEIVDAIARLEAAYAGAAQPIGGREFHTLNHWRA